MQSDGDKNIFVQKIEWTLGMPVVYGVQTPYVINAQNTVQDRVREEYRPFPRVCQRVVLRRNGTWQAQLWGASKDMQEYWLRDLYGQIQNGDVVEIELVFQRPVGPAADFPEYPAGGGCGDAPGGSDIWSGHASSGATGPFEAEES